MSKVLQTDGSNRACYLVIWRHQGTQDAYHQAASQLVFTCTVTAICCKSSRSIHSSKVLQTDGSNRACNLVIWRHGATKGAKNHQAATQLVFTCTVAAICCKSSRSIHSNVKGLANRWQQPRLQPRDLAPWSNQRSKKPPSSYSASLHLHGCRNLLQILKIHTFKCQRSCKQMAATAPATS